MSSNITCDFCGSSLSSIYTLKLHLTTNKKCLGIQGKEIENPYTCPNCPYITGDKGNIAKHTKICVHKKSAEEIAIDLQKEIQILKEQLKQKDILLALKEELKQKDILLALKEDEVRNNKKAVKKISTSSKEDQVEEKHKDALVITNKFKNEEIIKYEPFIMPVISTNSFIVTLQGTEYIIPIRPSDGYINLTELAKALEYRTNHYFESEKTQAYLKALSLLSDFRSIRIVDSTKGRYGCTFVHRHVVYNYLQYVKPEFAAYVSTVLDNLFITGKVELGKEKTSKELEVLYKENLSLSQDLTSAQNIITEQNTEIEKIKKIRPLLKRARPEFPAGNFIYVAVTQVFISKKTFKIGRTDNLKELYSVYNRINRTGFAYFRDCGSIPNAICVEQAIFNRLDAFRCQQNHELFNLKDNELSYFIDEIDETINFNLKTKGKGFVSTNIVEELENQDDFDPENEEEHTQVINKKFMAEINDEVRDLTIENRKLAEENSKLKILTSSLTENVSVLKKQISDLTSIEKITELTTKNKILEERQASSETKPQTVNNTTNINITISPTEAKELLGKINKFKDGELKNILERFNLCTQGLKNVKKKTLHDFLEQKI